MLSRSVTCRGWRALVAVLACVALCLASTTPAYASGIADATGATGVIHSVSSLVRQALAKSYSNPTTIGSSGKVAASDYEVIDFAYTGGIQTFTAPYSGTYKVEVWGAQGRGTGQHSQGSWVGSSGPGKGGYAKGSIDLTKGTVLYVVVGGQVGGYNGGGAGSGNGGGATHIATATGLLSSLSSNRGAVKIVAGGGGGSEWGGYGTGAGGGASGEPSRVGSASGAVSAGGGTQTAGGAAGTGAPWNQPGYTAQAGSFGKGGDGQVSGNPTTDLGPGGGGGWYGGGGQAYTGLGGGGSGYIGGVNSGTGSMSTGIREGNGMARITVANELIVDPNGGRWADPATGISSTSEQRFSAFSGTKAIPNPTREGYRFAGWVEVGTGKLNNIYNTNGDGAFTATTNNTVKVYNNSGNGAVTHTRVSETTPYGDQLIRISHSATLSSTPQLGGFYFAKVPVTGKTYMVVFSAKVPTGFYLQHSTNYIGENAVETWLTDRKGTGDWETYAYTATIGTPASGRTIDSTGFVFLTRYPDSSWGSTTQSNLGPAAEDVSWDLAYAEMYDVTAGWSFTFVDGSASSSRIIAQWEPISYKVNYHYQNDDDYKAGQADTLGATMDMGKDNRISGSFKPADEDGEALLFGTTNGTSDIRATWRDGRLGVSDGTTEAQIAGTVDASSGSPFVFHWDAVAEQADVSDGSFSESLIARHVYPGLSGTSEHEMRIGSADWSGSYAPTHVSDVTWTTSYDKGEEFHMPHPTRIGYRFLGWATTPTGTATYAANQSVTDLVTEGETDLYAQWELRSYTVAFDANGGAGGMPSQTFQWNEQKALDHSTILRFNWRFTGWNVEPDGSGTAYSDEQVVRNILERPVVTDNDYNITLYAQWERVSNTTQIDEGLWEVEVPANGRLTVNNLPAGASYEVAEMPKQDWVLENQQNTSGTVVPRLVQTSQFLNRYSPNETSLALSATKLLDGTAPLGSDYSFTLSGGKLAEPETVSNSGRGIQFSPVVYTADDIGQTFTYVMQEVEGNDPDIDYDTTPRTITVSVTSGAAGLVAEATYPDIGGTATFANTTKPGLLKVTKSVSGGTAKAISENEFPITVVLTDTLGAPVSGDFGISVDGTEVAGASVGIDGAVTVSISDGEELTVSDIPAGTRYSVTETYPAWFRQASATGTTGVIVPDAVSEAAFENAYVVSGHSDVVATKHLLGGALEKDEFSFRLLDSDGDVIGTATCEADGTVTFPPIPYGAGDDGKTYSYVMEEVDDGRDDVAYDATQKPVTVSVADTEGKGELDVSVSYGTPTGATFENKMLVEVPNTGRAGIVAAVATASALSVAAVAVIVSSRRRGGDGTHGNRR